MAKSIKYKVMKVYDCQDMNNLVQDAFLEIYDNVGNDAIVEYEVEFNEDGDDYEEQRKVLDKWLIGNGASAGEEVLIRHWW